MSVSTLLQAAVMWFSDRDGDSAIQDAVGDEESDLMTAYRAKLAMSRSSVSQKTVKRFFELVRTFGCGPPTSRSAVLRIQDSTRVVVAPLETPPGHYVASQKEAFLTLLEYWQVQSEIDELVIDLSGATRRLASELMRDVPTEGVLQGARIWETLPCRIRSIVVVEPKCTSLAWLVRHTTRSFAPPKVSRKTRFVAAAQHKVACTKQREVDGDADAVATGCDVDAT